jgi:hypothetical protein
LLRTGIRTLGGALIGAATVDRALRSSQAWTAGATRFLKDDVAESLERILVAVREAAI